MDTPVFDQTRPEAFAMRAVSDLSAGYAGVMVSLGSKLGLYKAMAGAGPVSAKELAARAECAERYVREWLNAQAAGGYVGLAPHGTVMLVEPFANDRMEDNISPVGRLYYAASSLLCCAHAISEGGKLVLGAQAGEARLAEVFRRARFTRFRRAAQTPFNMVLEARR